jgi:hydroxymethylbilane synthase
MKLSFATRPSALARWQTGWVIDRLNHAWPGLESEEIVITTQGDRRLDRPLPEIGGKGVFTQELEAALLEGRVDAAVHSLKDLPVENPAGLVVGCIPPRAETRDAWISGRGWTLTTIPEKAIVGTSSLRRAAQVKHLRPDLEIRSLRGNIDTRLRKALNEEYDAIILAGAGLVRLGLEANITEWLPYERMLPAPGQGALAIQCRSDDARALQLLAVLEDRAARRETTAERAFLAGLGGGCSLPVAAFARADPLDGAILLTGLVCEPEGRETIRVEGRGQDAEALGNELAQEALAAGARELLTDYGNE